MRTSSWFAGMSLTEGRPGHSRNLDWRVGPYSLLSCMNPLLPLLLLENCKMVLNFPQKACTKVWNPQRVCRTACGLLELSSYRTAWEPHSWALVSGHHPPEANL